MIKATSGVDTFICLYCGGPKQTRFGATCESMECRVALTRDEMAPPRAALNNYKRRVARRAKRATARVCDFIRALQHGRKPKQWSLADRIAQEAVLCQRAQLVGLDPCNRRVRAAIQERLAQTPIVWKTCG